MLIQAVTDSGKSCFTRLVASANLDETVSTPKHRSKIERLRGIHSTVTRLATRKQSGRQDAKNTSSPIPCSPITYRWSVARPFQGLTGNGFTYRQLHSVAAHSSRNSHPDQSENSPNIKRASHRHNFCLSSSSGGMNKHPSLNALESLLTSFSTFKGLPPVERSRINLSAL